MVKENLENLRNEGKLENPRNLIKENLENLTNERNLRNIIQLIISIWFELNVL